MMREQKLYLYKPRQGDLCHLLFIFFHITCSRLFFHSYRAWHPALFPPGLAFLVPFDVQQYLEGEPASFQAPLLLLTDRTS